MKEVGEGVRRLERGQVLLECEMEFEHNFRSDWRLLSGLKPESDVA